MKRRIVAAAVVAAGCALAGPVSGQSLGQIMGGVKKSVKAVQDASITDAEEQQIGADISARLREKYGVVQDAAVHRYVTLVGSVLAAGSTRPQLRWTFIVLDTDGVNAFAAPGGYVHITRGALALIANEAELADVLAHEITHVAQKHTVKAIEKSQRESAVVKEMTRSDYVAGLTNQLYSATLENKFDRGDESAADEAGVALANAAGWAPTGLGAFLSRLAQRNAGLKERSGLFASHPEVQSRLEALQKLIGEERLTSTATAQARYARAVIYKAVAVSDLAQVAAPSAAAAPPAETPKKSASGKFGLGGLNPLGREQGSSSTISSAGSRGVNPDRDAKGGPNKALVVVTVSAAEIAAFRKGIAG